MDEYSSQKSDGLSHHRECRKRITHPRTSEATPTTPSTSKATTTLNLATTSTSKLEKTKTSTLTTTTSKLTTDSRVAGRNVDEHLESQNASHESVHNACPSMAPSQSPQASSLSPQSTSPSSSSSPLRSNRLSTLYHDRNNRRCRVSPITSPSLPLHEHRTRTELDGNSYDGGGSGSSSDGRGGHNSSSCCSRSGDHGNSANLNNSIDVRKNKNTNVNKNNQLTVGRSKRNKGEGLSAVAVFNQESKFHIKDEGTNYYSVFNAASNYGSDSFADFDDSQNPDKEGDDDDDEEDNGTLIMAYDNEGNEVWVPKTMLEELGPSATVLPTDEMPGKKKGCCGFLYGQTRKKYVSSMLALQVIVNIAGLIGLVLVFVFYH